MAGPTRGKKGDAAPVVRKTTCPITRKEFSDANPTVPVNINGIPHTLTGRNYASGSLGFNLTDKVTLVIGGKAVKCQVGMNITVIGSKELPADGVPAEAEPLKEAA